MAAVTDLHDIALAWLAASIAAIDQTAAATPDRAYVSPGQPPIDCEQLVVWTQILGESPFQVGAGAEARSKAINRGGLAKLTVNIQIVRCVPVGRTRNSTYTPPEPAELEQAAQMIDEDGWALWLGLNAALKHEDGSLHEQCSGAERLGAEKLVPQGGFGGWFFSYRVPVNGGTLT